MRNYYLCLLFGLFLFSSCGKPSLEEDAQKAAEFTNMSNQRAADNDYPRAEKYYKDAQEIIDKYRGAENFQDFFTLYNGFLEAGAYQHIGVSSDDSNSSEKSDTQSKL